MELWWRELFKNTNKVKLKYKYGIITYWLTTISLNNCLKVMKMETIFCVLSWEISDYQRLLRNINKKFNQGKRGEMYTIFFMKSIPSAGQNSYFFEIFVCKPVQTQKGVIRIKSISLWDIINTFFINRYDINSIRSTISLKISFSTFTRWKSGIWYL